MKQTRPPERPGPVLALARRIADRAEAARRAGQLATFAELRSIAAELLDLHNEACRG